MASRLSAAPTVLLLDQELEVAGLTVFRDGADPATFHYLPAAPHLVRDGERGGLELLRYRGGPEGGLLFVDVALAVDTSRQAAARTALAERLGREPNLVPVLFHEGLARLTAFDVAGGTNGGGAASRLVERVLGTSTPSLLQGQRAVFAVRLSRDGAVLAEGALAGQVAPLLVVYELAFRGLRPARGLRAEVDYRQAYEFLRGRVAADSLVFRADLDREAEALRTEGHIRIVDVDYQGSDPQRLAERLREVEATLRELAETLFFRPAGSPAAFAGEELARSPTVGAAWAAEGGPRAAFMLRALDQLEEQSLNYDLSVTTVVTRRVAPQGALRPPEGGVRLRDVTLDWPPRDAVVEAFTLPGADWRGVDAIGIDLASGEEARSLVLSEAAPRASVVLPAGDLLHRVRALARPEAEDLGVPPDGEQGPFEPLLVEHLFVDPDTEAPRRRLRLVLAGLAERFAGRLTDGTRSLALLLDRARPEAEVVVWGRPGLRLTGSLETAGGGAETVDRGLAVGEGVVLLAPAPGELQSVRVVLNDPLDRYQRVVVELEESAAGQRETRELSAAQPTAEWVRRSVEGPPGAWRFRVETVGRNAEVRRSDWRETAGSLLVVGDADLRVETVEAILLPREDLLGLRLKLTSLAAPAGVTPVAEAFLDPSASRATLRLPFAAAAARRYRVEGELFLASELQPLAVVEETAEVLVLP